MKFGAPFFPKVYAMRDGPDFMAPRDGLMACPIGQMLTMRFDH